MSDIAPSTDCLLSPPLPLPDFQALWADMVQCSACPRLVAWRETVAQEKVKRFADELYWGRPVPSFGDPQARLLIVGLAPAAQGGNRTGRMFTGDRSGDWLYRALHKAGFANQAESTRLSDGLYLKDCYITATAHCAPPQNKLLPAEVKQCRPFLEREWALLAPSVRVILALGQVGWDAILRHPTLGLPPRTAKPTFGHGVAYPLQPNLTLIGSYHPSQQNTFTGKLTEPMFDAVFTRIREILAQGERSRTDARRPPTSWEQALHSE